MKKTSEDQSAEKQNRGNEIGFYLLAGLLGLSFVLCVGYIIYAMFI
ncbi:MAG: hypothetical protein ACM3S2_20940 [Ignavibacteriales bacterium]